MTTAPTIPTAPAAGDFALIMPSSHTRGQNGNPNPASWFVVPVLKTTAASVMIPHWSDHPERKERVDLRRVVARSPDKAAMNAAKAAAMGAWNAAADALKAARDAQGEQELLHAEALKPYSAAVAAALTARRDAVAAAVAAALPTKEA